MNKPILDPPAPFVGPICGGKFNPGKMIRIHGTSSAIAYRFSINLQCGPETTPRDDIAIQGSVQFLEGYISFNSLQHGIWGEEQRGAGLPIKRAERFEIIIMCDCTQYKVAINLLHYCEFPQRVHYDLITHLAIDGDVSIIQISYESASVNGVSPPSAPGPVVSISLPSVQNEDKFEMIDSTATPAPSSGMYSGASDRGSTNENQPFIAPPAGSAYPAAVACSTGASYSAEPPGGASYLPGAPGVVGASPYLQPRVPGMPPPPPGPPVPLNSVLPSNQPAKSRGWQKCCASFCGCLFTIIIITGIVAKLAKTF